MEKPNDLPQTNHDTKVNIINAVKTPLGFFVLVVLIVEVVFGISASFSVGNDKTYLIIGMLALIFLMVLIVAGMALFRPSSLYGISPAQTKYPEKEKKNLARNVDEADVKDLGNFFGSDIFSDDFKVVYGLYKRIEPSTSSDEWPKIYEKVYSNKTVYQLRAPYLVTTADALRGITYFVQEFSKYRESHFQICTDSEAIPMYHASSFLTVGGPVSNELSDLALKEKGNKFLNFSGDLEQKKLPHIHVLSNNKTFKRQEDEKGQDYGIIMKVKNGQNPEKFIFLCGGIGSMGTSAAVWYLTHYWKSLYKEFGTEEFGIVISTEREHDNMAKMVYSAGI